MEFPGISVLPSSDLHNCQRNRQTHCKSSSVSSPVRVRPDRTKRCPMELNGREAPHKYQKSKHRTRGSHGM